jgi:hypothetical protein
MLFLNPKDSTSSERRPALRFSTRWLMSSRRSWTPMREVSMTRSAAFRMGSSSRRSMAMASFSDT